MAYYSYSNTTRELEEISDFPLAPQGDIAVGYVEGLTKAELETYTWDKTSGQFIATPRRIFSKREFLKRLTVDEYSAIRAATATDPTVDYYWQLIMLTDRVDLNDPDVITGLSTFVQAGLLTEQRKQEILA